MEKNLNQKFFFSSKWRAERSYVTGLRRWRKYSAYRKYAKAMSGPSGEERQLLTTAGFFPHITWQFCSGWKQAITLTAIPFSCLNTRNLVCAAAFHTISTPLRSPQKLWPSNHSTLTATPETGWGSFEMPSQAYESGMSPVSTEVIYRITRQ